MAIRGAQLVDLDRGEDFYLATREDFYLATREDIDLATREDFLMAMYRWPLPPRLWRSTGRSSATLGSVCLLRGQCPITDGCGSLGGSDHAA